MAQGRLAGPCVGWQLNLGSRCGHWIYRAVQHLDGLWRRDEDMSSWQTFSPIIGVSCRPQERLAWLELRWREKEREDSQCSHIQLIPMSATEILHDSPDTWSRLVYSNKSYYWINAQRFLPHLPHVGFVARIKIRKGHIFIKHLLCPINLLNSCKDSFQRWEDMKWNDPSLTAWGVKVSSGSWCWLCWKFISIVFTTGCRGH